MVVELSCFWFLFWSTIWFLNIIILSNKRDLILFWISNMHIVFDIVTLEISVIVIMHVMNLFSVFHNIWELFRLHPQLWIILIEYLTRLSGIIVLREFSPINLICFPIFHERIGVIVSQIDFSILVIETSYTLIVQTVLRAVIPAIILKMIIFLIKGSLIFAMLLVTFDIHLIKFIK